MVNFLCSEFIIIAPPCEDDNGQQNRAILVPSKAAKSSSSAKLKGEARKQLLCLQLNGSPLIFNSKKTKPFVDLKQSGILGEKIRVEKMP